MAALRLTATELTQAILDPAYRAKWLAGERPSTRSYAPPGSSRALSLKFHKEAEALVNWLTGPQTLRRAALVGTSAQLLDHLWASSLQALSDKLFEAGRGEEAAAFVARMRAFCERLAGLPESPVAFPVGVGVEGEPLVADLADPDTCHALVAGATGSGKSEWLKSLVAAIASRCGPESVRFALVDPKILAFSAAAGSPYLWRPLATTLEEASAVLRDAVEEMEARYRRLDAEGFAHLVERRAAGRTDLPYLVLVFDEFADLML